MIITTWNDGNHLFEVIHFYIPSICRMHSFFPRRVLTLLVCFSQRHKYVIKAEVLSKSLDLGESELASVHAPRDLDKNEIRGTVHTKNTTYKIQ